jgi:CRP/FNR family transcriptional regulator
MRNKPKIEILRHSGVFAGLSADELTNLADLAVEQEFEAGSFIFWEGQAPEWLFVLVDGRVKVIKHSPSGKEFIVAFFGAGEMFGEVAVFQEQPYPATAQAVEETRVLGIRRADLLGFLAQNPKVALRIISVLGSRLRDAQNRLKDLAIEHADQRIARMLVMLSARLGTTLPFTRQEIAEMTGTTVETAIRVTSRFKDAGILRTVRGKVEIIDLAALRNMAEGQYE